MRPWHYVCFHGAVVLALVPFDGQSGAAWSWLRGRFVAGRFLVFGSVRMDNRIE